MFRVTNVSDSSVYEASPATADDLIRFAAHLYGDRGTVNFARGGTVATIEVGAEVKAVAFRRADPADSTPAPKYAGVLHPASKARS